MLRFDPNKAGMEGIDKEKVNRVIAESTGTLYSNFTQKQQQRVDQKVAEIKKKLAIISEHEWTSADKEINTLLVKLEATRDLTRHCVHIDMDAYFAAVEMRDEPRLRSVPMAVGTLAMLGTSNYSARKYGVRAAMPGFIAKRLCPELEIVEGDYDKYRKESRIFSEIFASYDFDMAMGSLDEAYIDLTEFMQTRKENNTLTRRRYGGDCICRLPLIKEEDISENLSLSIETCKKCLKDRKVYEDIVEFGTSRAEVVREIRFKVEQATGLTCSAGIATNFMLAKICSDKNKPNGQFELDNDYNTVMDFLKDLPIRKVSGIGKVSEAHLMACGINTVGELLAKRTVLKFVFSPLAQESFIRIALGLPGRARAEDSRRKSISVERTFSPTSSESELMLVLRRVSEELMHDVGKKSYILGAKCVTVKIKLSSFDVLTRSQTLPDYIDDLEVLYSVASEILRKELGQEMRLLGVRFSQLKCVDDSPAASSRTVLDYFSNPKRSKPNNAQEDDEVLYLDAPCSSSALETTVSEDINSEGSGASESVDSSDIVSCPICSKKLKGDNIHINQHIDECLNSEVLKSEKLSVPKKNSSGVTQENPLTKSKSTNLLANKPAKAPSKSAANLEKRGIKRFFTSE